MTDKKKSLDEIIFYNNLILDGVSPVVAKLKSIVYSINKAKYNTKDEFITSYNFQTGKMEKTRNPNWEGNKSVEEKVGSPRGGSAETGVGQEGGKQFDKKLQNTLNMIRDTGQTRSEVASRMGETGNKEITPEKPKDETGKKQSQNPNTIGTQTPEKDSFGIGTGNVVNPKKPNSNVGVGNTKGRINPERKVIDPNTGKTRGDGRMNTLRQGKRQRAVAEQNSKQKKP